MIGGVPHNGIGPASVSTDSHSVRMAKWKRLTEELIEAGDNESVKADAVAEDINRCFSQMTMSERHEARKIAARLRQTKSGDQS